MAEHANSFFPLFFISLQTAPMFPPRPISLTASLRPPPPPRLPYRSRKAARRGPKSDPALLRGGIGPAVASALASAPLPVAGVVFAGAGAAGMAGILALAGAAVP